MPRGDRTGPDGMGPMSGRGLGYCNAYESPGFTKCAAGGGFGFGRGSGFGRGAGYGRGMGFGRGFARRAYPGPYYAPAYPPERPYDKKEELRYLKDQAQQMREELDTVNDRIGELEKEEKA